MKITIKRNTNGDTRVAKRTPTFSEFERANNEHIFAVKGIMEEFAKRINSAGVNHDHTKMKEPERSMFYRELCETIEGKMKFEDGEWLKRHYETERHHLEGKVPEKVNLIDVMEMIADCVAAGLERSGYTRKIEISEGVLQEAVKNTADMMVGFCEIEE